MVAPRFAERGVCEGRGQTLPIGRRRGMKRERREGGKEGGGKETEEEMIEEDCEN